MNDTINYQNIISSLNEIDESNIVEEIEKLIVSFNEIGNHQISRQILTDTLLKDTEQIRNINILTQMKYRKNNNISYDKIRESVVNEVVYILIKNANYSIIDFS